MKLRFHLAATLAITLALWAAVSWPLPVRMHDAIPCSSLNPHRQPPRMMIPGDHLQLLYRFWLFGDILKGNSPWGSNVYEFNRGDDAERRQPGAYYLPFSLVHVIVAEAFGAPFGWNVTSLLALWLTYLFTVLLLGFHTDDRWRAYVFGAVAILFPYRYHALFGGSPTGFAMMWPPMVAFGLEWALRKDRLAGGLVAGAGLFLTCISDLQLFFFVFLMAVVWGGALFLHRWIGRGETFGALFGSAIRSLWPVAVALAGAYAYSRHLKHFVAESTHMAAGRDLSEVALYSPKLASLFSLDASHNLHGTYLGWAWIALGLAAAAVLLWRARSRQEGRNLAVAGLWAAGLAGLIVLSLGTNGPRGGLVFVLARRLLPPLQMIRQPARFLTLAPTLIPVMLAMVTAGWFRQLRKRTIALVLALFAIAMGAEYLRATRVELCLLDARQGAYAAVRADHEARFDTPARALAIPLWPGDSHWSSLYQHYASLYGIRMLNGYNPVVREEYYEGAFEPLRSLNAGTVRRNQLDMLLDMGIHYLLLHEDAFPEIVSPFPVSYTLNRLAGHPRLERLAKEGRVWAFRILEEPVADTERILPCDIAFPTRRYYPARHRLNAPARFRDDSAIRQWALTLSESFPAAYVTFSSLKGRRDASWLLRVRGQGTLVLAVQGDTIFQASPLEFEIETETPDIALHLLFSDDDDDYPDALVDWTSETYRVDAESWTWLAVSAKQMPDYAVGHVMVKWIEGQVDLDHLCLTTAQAPIEDLTMAAACFFRSGETDPETASVLFEPQRDLKGRVFYGPRLPFVAGSYRVEMLYESDAPPGERLGTWVIEQPEHTAKASMPVLAGQPAVLDMHLPDSVPVLFSYHFAARHPVRIREVRATPVAAPTALPLANLDTP